MSKAERVTIPNKVKINEPVIGVFAACDPRIDKEARERAKNIITMTADKLAGNVLLVDGSDVKVVYSDLLVDGEKEADIVAERFKDAGVNVLVCVPDTWAFPQLTVLSLLAHFPKDTPLNLSCGNSGPRPGVVFVHATNGALAQSGILTHINVGNWPDNGQNPVMSDETADELIHWAYAAVTHQSLKGRRLLVFGHDSMGMETALSHVIPTRNTFGLEITRLDMKLLADMLRKKAYKRKELDELYSWISSFGKDKIELRDTKDEERFKQSLAMYLIVRNLMADLNAVGGGFMSQLEWGSDTRGKAMPVADVMESLFNSTFDHKGRKAPIPFATEADTQALLTMLFFTHLSGGTPPLFMDFRKVWEPWEIKKAADELNVKYSDKDIWAVKGFVDGNNSGSASFDWAALPGTDPNEIMKNVSFPLAGTDYFPGGGNAVHFVTPKGINGVAGRLNYSELKGMFSLVWDEAETVGLGDELSKKVYNSSTAIWPHTYLVPKYANMLEYKQYAPANHLHMNWGLAPKRLEYWMDMANVLSVTPWQERPDFVSGTDRPLPLLYLLNGGETECKIARARK